MGLGRCQITEYSGLSGNSLLLLAYIGHTTNQRSSPFGYLLCLLRYGQQDPRLCFLESIVTEEIDGGGYRGSEGNTTFDLQTLLEAILIISLEQRVALLKLFFPLAKSNTFTLGTTIIKCWIIRISKL